MPGVSRTNWGSRSLCEYISSLSLAGGEHDGESFAVLP